MSTILVTGSRGYDNLAFVRAFIFEIARAEVRLFVGDARGVDAAAAEAWRDATGLDPVVFKPDWDKHRRPAGLIRNAQMVDQLEPRSVVFAFWDGKSSGTRHCMTYARKKGHTVYQPFMDFRVWEG